MGLDSIRPRSLNVASCSGYRDDLELLSTPSGRSAYLIAAGAIAVCTGLVIAAVVMAVANVSLDWMASTNVGPAVSSSAKDTVVCSANVD